MNSDILVNSFAKMHDVARKLIKKCQEENINCIGLVGNLGAGKTYFVKQVGKILGVKEIINSPTFVIMKQYKIANKDFKTLIHIDAYRLDSNAFMSAIDLDELVNNKHAIIFIEWANNIKDILPQKCIKVVFNTK